MSQGSPGFMQFSSSVSRQGENEYEKEDVRDDLFTAFADC